MKKLLLAAGIATALTGVQPSFADTLKITNGSGQVLDNLNLSSFIYNSSTGQLTVSTSANVVVDGGSTTPDPDPTNPDPDSDNDPEPVPEPAPGECADAPSNVTCTGPMAWASGESNVRIAIPAKTILATPFVTTSSEERAGMITFENVAPLVAMDIWVSKAPGGPALSGSFCSISNQSLSYSLRWAQYDSRRNCSLVPGTKYFFNIKQTNTRSTTSYTTRTRTSNGN